MKTTILVSEDSKGGGWLFLTGALQMCRFICNGKRTKASYLCFCICELTLRTHSCQFSRPVDPMGFASSAEKGDGGLDGSLD